MTYRLRNIVVAVGLALIAALLTTFYVANYKKHVRQTEATVTVYVATRDIPQGTPGGDLIRHKWIKPAEVIQRTVVPGAISDPEQVRALLTTEPIYTGEQVSLRRFADHAQQGIRSQLHGTLRAVSLPGTSDELLAGTLHDGDHVDVLANLKTGDCSTCFADRVIARNVLVLTAPSSPSAGAKVGGTTTSEESVVLAVSDSREAQKVFYAVQNSSGWSLVLRPVANAVDSSEDVEGISTMLQDGVSPTNLNRFKGAK
ncbi:MAG TPA: Flp pilus assembly protein CpaB [Gaiellaceae bacterium]